MAQYKNPQYPLRIRQEIIDKMKFIAHESSRSANKEIEQACIAYITRYEDKFGEISEEDLEKFFDKLC